jgi:hypothetical protein
MQIKNGNHSSNLYAKDIHKVIVSGMTKLKTQSIQTFNMFWNEMIIMDDGENSDTDLFHEFCFREKWRPVQQQGQIRRKMLLVI